jgi:O-antigen ligase
VINNLDSNTNNFQDFCKKASFFCAISFMVFIPSSTALMNIFIFLTFIFVLFSGNLKNNLKMVWQNPVSRSALLLFLILTVSLNWTIDSSEAVDVLKKYNELWYFALLLPIFNSNIRRDIGINAFLISMAVILIGVYLMYFDLMLPIYWTLKGSSGHFTINGGFASHILTNILMAFAMFVSAQMSVTSKFLMKIPYLIFLGFSSFYVLFISTGTSGQILASCLILLFIIQHGGVRSVLLIPGIILLIGITAITNKTFYESSIIAIAENNSMQALVVKMQERYHHATTTDTAGNNTRPRIYIHALKLIREEPWIGSGVGSYEEALRRYQPDFHNATSIAKKNPHNEYLMISVQLGAVGLLLLLNLFYTQAAYSEKIPNKKYRYISQGLVILIIIGCMGNSMILDSREGHFWAFFSALLFSQLSIKET